MNPSHDDETHFDRMLRQVKNRPLLAVLLLAGVGIVALGQLTGAIDSILGFSGKFSQQNKQSVNSPNEQESTAVTETQPQQASGTVPADSQILSATPSSIPASEVVERSPEQQHVVSAGPISAPPVTPANPAESPSEERAFEADTYRLTVDIARMTAGKIAVTLIIHNTSSEGVYFEAADWYLVDESGNQWFPYRLSKVISKLPGFQSEKAKEGLRQMDPLQQRIYIAAGTSFRGDIVFKSSNSDIGREFTLVALEKKPIQGREIVVRGISVEE